MILFCSSLFFAQSESQIGWIAKFGAAGGFTPIIIFPNYDVVNSKISQFGMNELSGPLFSWGGGGYAYVMIIDNLRLGGIGFTGSKSETSDFGSVNNETQYSLGGGALTVEYTMPFVKNMALSAGFMIGGGSLDIDTYKNSGKYNWNSVWDEIISENPSNSLEVSMKNSFYFITPTVNLDFPITRFLAVRGGVGYQLTFGNDWKIANSKKLNDVPSGLNGNGFIIQTGILIGLFAF